MATVSEPPGEQRFHAVTAAKPNALVAWYLLASYAYYQLDESILADTTYDAMCKRLNAEWDSIVHPHKHLIDRAALGAGTAYHMKENDFPEIVRSAAARIIREGVQSIPEVAPVIMVRKRVRPQVAA